ncbi:hypothetical protein [Chryseobacterium sp. SC28]|uniref:hypothetical protein n=1 Tax=Chryseobacterium sp. SC28 TaxID=2268028 RepID=UPI000F649FD2|nr:hypothetical protein [Chryseobacterium sp. SC28]RRQ46282.1 hypothetical protein DTW91_06235 [Chryseobacterium sp. SC28]
MTPNKKPERNNASEQKKQTEDFKNIPAASDKQNPPDIDKKDIDQSSKANKDGKTDNTKK